MAAFKKPEHLCDPVSWRQLVRAYIEWFGPRNPDWQNVIVTTEEDLNRMVDDEILYWERSIFCTGFCGFKFFTTSLSGFLFAPLLPIKNFVTGTPNQYAIMYPDSILEKYYYFIFNPSNISTGIGQICYQKLIEDKMFCFTKFKCFYSPNAPASSGNPHTFTLPIGIKNIGVFPRRITHLAKPKNQNYYSIMFTSNWTTSPVSQIYLPEFDDINYTPATGAWILEMEWTYDSCPWYSE